MTINEVRRKYLEFMKSKGHVVLQSSSLVPENDPTTLFTAAGMQPMINYILGEKHPMDTRISDTQKCFRSQDIEEVGDNRHTTFFEMLGNWSFGDYFKKDQISFMYEFLTDTNLGLGLDKDRLYFSCYSGNENLGLSKDDESKNFWIENGIDESHISFYDDKKNWWSRSGTPEKMPEGEPGGPDSEMFFDFDPKGEKKIHENSKFKDETCHPNCDCGRFIEIGNSVFIQYKKILPASEGGVSPSGTKGTLVELEQKNVDFGGGLTRMAAATVDDNDIFNLDVFADAKNILENISSKNYNDSEENKFNFRIIFDHVHAATFLIGDGVVPGNKDQMYFVRRLIRRAIVAGHKLNIHENFTKAIGETFINKYKEAEEYLGDNLSKNKEKILDELDKEETKFRKTLNSGMREFEKIITPSPLRGASPKEAVGADPYLGEGVRRTEGVISGEQAFNLLQSFGFPIELTQELANEAKIKVDLEGFLKLKTEHAEKSRTSSEGMFKGGLADQGEVTTALHTACHLMLAGMRKVLGDGVTQKGSNITPERLRFDFTFIRKITDEEKKKIEDYVNDAIKNGFDVSIDEIPKEKAKADGVTGAFWEKYPEIVKVYTMKGRASTGSADGEIYSRELCGGPHVENSDNYLKGKTFSIIKEEAVSGGVRRFKGVLK